jgi:SAM-dependent methyltransferase
MSEFWNQKFSAEHFYYGEEPNKFIKSESYRIHPKSKILCLAEGEGRNGVFLATQGHSVVCVDLSDVGLQKAQSLANQNSVEIKTVHSDIFHFDSEEWFDAAICTFLHLDYGSLRLFCEKLHRLLGENGLFIGQFFTKDQLGKSSGGPQNIDLLYDPNVLEKAFKFAGFEVLKISSKDEELNEGEGHSGIASLVSIVAKNKGQK